MHLAARDLEWQGSLYSLFIYAGLIQTQDALEDYF